MIFVFLVGAALAAGILYSGIKVVGDIAADRHALGFLGLVSLLGSLGALVFLGLMAGLGMH